MTSSDIIKLRLFNQQIAETKFNKPQELVAWMGAMQAQDYGMAKWAIGLRLPGLGDSDVEKVFNDGIILRTHVLRPTWHFVMPADIRWMLELTAPRIIPLLASNDRKLGLDKNILKRSNDVLAKALQGGKQFTRGEVRTLLEKSKIASNDLRLIHLLMHAELEGIICSGAKKGKQFTYALLDERAPNAKTMTREEALVELTKRYFTSRGPSTLLDFAWWSGLLLADTKKGIEMAGSDFKKEMVDGKEYFFKSLSFLKKEISEAAYLLPNYDEYMIGYKERTATLNERHTAKLAIGRNTIFSNSILINGKIEGIWQRAIKNNSVTIQTNAFSPLSKAKQRALVKAAKTYAKFLGKSAQVVR
jgi:hypothetical protein